VGRRTTLHPQKNPIERARRGGLADFRNTSMFFFSYIILVLQFFSLAVG
jgi:hypothetical protein